MTRERIEEFRKVLLPFVKKWLLRINYENRGKSDAEEFEKDFNEILDLAIKALEQEPKPMIEIDLYSVIKQKYIERDVLDKIRAEITICLKALDEIEKSGLNIYLPNEISGRRLTYQQCLEFIDKYRAETEGKE